MGKNLDNELLTIPGVGASISGDLNDLGIFRLDDLQDKSPEILYDELCSLRMSHIDRCVLYVFRCAVYFAENRVHDPELLKWWNWSDDNIGKRQ